MTVIVVKLDSLLEQDEVTLKRVFFVLNSILFDLINNDTTILFTMTWLQVRRQSS